MAKKLISAEILQRCMNLSLAQVAAAMESGGATVSLTSAKFLGMTPSGAFVYQCTGDAFKKKWKNPRDPTNFDYDLENEKWPDYLAEFKVKIVYEKNHLKNFRPEFQARAKERMLSNEFIVAWG